MIVIKPKRYPHVPCKAYTIRGFTTRVIPRLCRELNISKEDAEKLMSLYFPRGFTRHLDTFGTYRNSRHYCLYRLSRKLGKDRKRGIFSIVELSELFYLYYYDDGRFAGFLSPWVHSYLGIIPFERL